MCILNLRFQTESRMSIFRTFGIPGKSLRPKIQSFTNKILNCLKEINNFFYGELWKLVFNVSKYCKIVNKSLSALKWLNMVFSIFLSD